MNISNESTPSVSMDSGAHYVLPSFHRFASGKMLTDRRIAQLQKQGYYNGGIVLRTAKQAKRKRRTGTDKLFAQFLK